MGIADVIIQLERQLNSSKIGPGGTSVRVTQLPERVNTITVPPTPLKIKPQQLETDPAAPLTLLCTTSPFSPKNISFTWYKDGTITKIGINTIIKPSTNGLYEASSQLQEAQPARSLTVYTCLVFHSALQIPAITTHIVTYPNTGDQSTNFLLISASAGGGFVLLMFGLIIVKHCVTKKNNGMQKDGERCHYPEQQFIQGAVEMLPPYAAPDTTNSQKTPRHQEQAPHIQTKQRLPNNKLTYAALDMIGSKKTAKPNHKDKSTEYAELKMGKQRAGVIYTEPKAT
ncbi:uncharacterized protein LOC144493123 [Mustelus asterias]